MRCKTRIVGSGKEPKTWGFDGSSTNQAPGANSDCVLEPVFVCPDPIRNGDNVLVLCDVLLPDGTPHATNTRAACAAAAEEYADQEPMFGIEQEYTFMQNGRPLGWPEVGYPAPQGPYYCGVGGGKMVGREIIEAHTIACLNAGLSIEGTNAEGMMAQREFQLGVLPAPRCAAGSGMGECPGPLRRRRRDGSRTGPPTPTWTPSGSPASSSRPAARLLPRPTNWRSPLRSSQGQFGNLRRAGARRANVVRLRRRRVCTPS